MVVWVVDCERMERKTDNNGLLRAKGPCRRGDRAETKDRRVSFIQSVPAQMRRVTRRVDLFITPFILIISKPYLLWHHHTPSIRMGVLAYSYTCEMSMHNNPQAKQWRTDNKVQEYNERWSYKVSSISIRQHDRSRPPLLVCRMYVCVYVCQVGLHARLQNSACARPHARLDACGQ